MLNSATRYEDVVAKFSWQIPQYYNIGVDVSDRQNPNDLAILFRDCDDQVREYTFGDLSRLSNRFANVLIAHGLRREDRVGILLPQAPETAVSHIAAYKAGLIAVPLFILFGEEALEYRLASCGARAVVTDSTGLPKILAIRDQLPELRVIFCIDGPLGGLLILMMF